MEPVSIALSVGSLVIAAGSLLFARLADKRSKEANRLAKESLAQADTANRIATDANELSNDANQRSERALAITAEQTDYAWGFNVDENGAASIRNGSTECALDLTVLVDVEGTAKTDLRQGSVAVLEEIRLELHGTTQEHFEKVRSAPIIFDGFYGPYRAQDGRTVVTTEIRAFIVWSTPAGKRLSAVVVDYLRHRETAGGEIVTVVDFDPPHS